ncbi:2-oxoacid dehydrogenases acyltransferase-domain-containing protein [Xylaria nigripes]|nr:2-oxoacid dehydrogenases acyltransferase-domain-containing protein [Xylaria nigripes]
MLLQRSSRALRRQWRICQSISRVSDPQTCNTQQARTPACYVATRDFHATRRMQVVKPVLLADIGEGIVECEIIQWFVEPEARVEEFSPLCEVQSDKASVEITSRFAGVVKKLHYDAGEMAKVGKPFVDIDIVGDAKPEVLDALTAPDPSQKGNISDPPNQTSPSQPLGHQQPEGRAISTPQSSDTRTQSAARDKGRFASLATPAVRHLCKELDVEITDVSGTGKGGRVLKEDVYKFAEARDSGKQSAQPASTIFDTSSAAPTAGKQTETIVPLTITQQQMFKTMTRSLSIPHFMYADEVDFSQLFELRRRLNKVLSTKPVKDGAASKLSYLPFIIKAVSIALLEFPILNARVDIDPQTSKPTLVHRSQHNIGVAMDTPMGLLVPVIKNVAAKSVQSIANELADLQSRATAGKLSVQDLSGGTITVSNIGNIGGTYLSPVIVDKEVAILGIGRIRTVPAFDAEDRVIKKQVCNFSWSADHRVIDGATMARAAEVIRRIVAEPDSMVLHLR